MFPPLLVLVLWVVSMRCETQIIVLSIFIWIIAPFAHDINLPSVFVWVFLHVHGSTYSNKCSCVYYNVRGSSEHTGLFVCIPRAHSLEWPHILEQKTWLTIFFISNIYMYIYIYKLIIGEYLQMLMLLRLMSLEDKNNILKLSDCEKYLINLLIPIQI